MYTCQFRQNYSLEKQYWYAWEEQKNKFKINVLLLGLASNSLQIFCLKPIHVTRALSEVLTTKRLTNGFTEWWSNNSTGGFVKKINSNSDKTITLNLKIFKHMNLIRDCTTLGLNWDHTGQAIYIADFTIAKRRFKIEGVINRLFFIFWWMVYYGKWKAQNHDLIMW